MTDTDLNYVLEQSFNDENNRNNNEAISTSENVNVSRLFTGNELKKECFICYENNIGCIKCFQCTAIYCKTCLIKIASEYDKCSVCCVTITDNYKKLYLYNKKLQNKHNKHNKNNNKNNNIENIIQNINENIIQNTQQIRDINREKLQDIKNNNIYNIEFTSFRSEISHHIPNYRHKWDYNNKTLTFYIVPIVHNNSSTEDIIINYSILNAEFQAILNIYFNELLKYSMETFKSKWKLLSLKIKKFNLKYKDQNHQTHQNHQNNSEYNIDRKNLIENIEIICK